ncbi:MAG: ribbon-helix-helix protein, CopG family [Methylophaga sp.]|nr:ribbon-helix-helix protein, CopG family [Methylophaga sp.]
MSVITARIDDKLEARLANLAKSVDRKKSYFVRKAIEMSIEDLEDIYEAEAIVLKIREGKEKTYTLDEVKRELDLAD